MTPKDKMADFLGYYETALDLDVWNSTQVVESRWDGVKKEWTVVLEQNKNGKISTSNSPHSIYFVSVRRTHEMQEHSIPTI